MKRSQPRLTLSATGSPFAMTSKKPEAASAARTAALRLPLRGIIATTGFAAAFTRSRLSPGARLPVACDHEAGLARPRRLVGFERAGPRGAEGRAPRQALGRDRPGVDERGGRRRRRAGRVGAVGRC